MELKRERWLNIVLGLTIILSFLPIFLNPYLGTAGMVLVTMAVYTCGFFVAYYILPRYYGGPIEPEGMER
jgi:uncharacterized membrane protein YedE/YeeE